MLNSILLSDLTKTTGNTGILTPKTHCLLSNSNAVIFLSILWSGYPNGKKISVMFCCCKWLSVLYPVTLDVDELNSSFSVVTS